MRSIILLLMLKMCFLLTQSDQKLTSSEYQYEDEDDDEEHLNYEATELNNNLTGKYALNCSYQLA